MSPDEHDVKLRRGRTITSRRERYGHKRLAVIDTCSRHCAKAESQQWNLCNWPGKWRFVRTMDGVRRDRRIGGHAGECPAGRRSDHAPPSLHRRYLVTGQIQFKGARGGSRSALTEDIGCSMAGVGICRKGKKKNILPACNVSPVQHYPQGGRRRRRSPRSSPSLLVALLLPLPSFPAFAQLSNKRLSLSEGGVYNKKKVVTATRRGPRSPSTTRPSSTSSTFKPPTYVYHLTDLFLRASLLPLAS